MTDLEYKIATEFKEVYHRLSVLEQDIKRHEDVFFTIAWIVGAILTLLSIVTVPLLVRWLRWHIKSLVTKALQPQIDAAKETVAITRREFDEQLLQIRASRDEAKIYLEVLKERAHASSKTDAVPLDYDIQFGERVVKFKGSNYLAMDQVFEREFSTVPQVFVTEGRAGRWLVVKVDSKDAKKFTWAANNLLGASDDETVIQWVAIAKRPPKETPEIPEEPKN